jgi:hypothetical protein
MTERPIIGTAFTSTRGRRLMSDMDILTQADHVVPGDYLPRWRDTVAHAKSDGEHVVFTLTNDGDTHRVHAETAVAIRRGPS